MYRGMAETLFELDDDEDGRICGGTRAAGGVRAGDVTRLCRWALCMRVMERLGRREGEIIVDEDISKEEAGGQAECSY